MLYFAYGSNLDEAQMRTRCPGSRRLARATLPSHSLLFAGWSRRWGGSVASVQPASEGEVPGLIYELGDTDLAHLDRIEGYPAVYQRAERLVIDEHGGKHEAHVYFLPEPEAGLPTREYLTVILRAYGRLAFDEAALQRAALAGPARHRVFVYGTLLSGEHNHHHLQAARLLGAAATRAEYTMFSLGSYPGVVRGGESVIPGEVYEVDAATLAALDHLEGHPHFYRRTRLTLDGFGRVETYLLTAAQVEGRPPIASGNWRLRQA